MNLATRPFYNDRAVHLVLGGVGLTVVAVLVLGGMRLAELSRTHRALTLRAEALEREAASVATRTARYERETPADALASLHVAAEETNRLIERRLFSWSALLNVIERTLPSDVMLTAVRPDADEQGTSVDLTVIGRTVADIEEFIRRLEASGAVADVLARQGELDDGGMYRARLRGRLVRLDETGDDGREPTGDR